MCMNVRVAYLSLLECSSIADSLCMLFSQVPDVIVHICQCSLFFIFMVKCNRVLVDQVLSVLVLENVFGVMGSNAYVILIVCMTKEKIY